MGDTIILRAYKVGPEGIPSYEPFPGRKTVPDGVEVSSVAKAEPVVETQVGRETPTSLGALIMAPGNPADQDLFAD